MKKNNFFVVFLDFFVFKDEKPPLNNHLPRFPITAACSPKLPFNADAFFAGIGGPLLELLKH